MGEHLWFAMSDYDVEECGGEHSLGDRSTIILAQAVLERHNNLDISNEDGNECRASLTGASRLPLS